MALFGGNSHIEAINFLLYNKLLRILKSENEILLPAQTRLSFLANIMNNGLL